MSDDIVFIKDENDYNEYKKLRPVYFYREQKVKFICSSCKNESIRCFKTLKLNFLCKKCTYSISQSAEETKKKKRLSNFKKYGVEYVAQAETIKEKIRQTNLKKYGTEYYFQSEDSKNKVKKYLKETYNVNNISQVDNIKEKKRQTCLKHYGVDIPVKSKNIQRKMENTCHEKYGTNSYSKTDEYKKRVKETNISKYGTEFYNQSAIFKKKIRQTWQERLNTKLNKCNIILLERTNKQVTLQCKDCNYIFKISRSGCINLLNSYCKNFCPNCSRIIMHGKSLKEKELCDYVHSIYDGPILENDRTVIAPRELDIYLPEKKLAIEFDGTYWHADPRFFNENDKIDHKSITAKEIWEKDRIKERLCESIGIRLFRVKEYDWKTDTEVVKSEIEKIIKQ